MTSAEPGDMTDRAWIKGVAIFCLVLLVYIPSYSCGFIWDDDTFLTINPVIHAADGLFTIWFRAETPDYFPLTSSMLWIEWRLWGMNALGYHAVSVVLHAGSCILLWRVLLRLEVPGAFLAGLLFAVHPVCVESVTWITERKNTLPMLFYLASILAYLRFEDRSAAGQPAGRRYAIALLLFLLALLAKTSVAILPVVLLGCAWWRRGTITRQDIKRSLPFFALSLILGLVTVWYQTNMAIGDEVVRDDSMLSRLMISGWAVWFYLYKAVLPFGLSFIYPRWEADTGSLLGWVPLLLLIVGFVVMWRARRSWGRPWLFASGYYVVGLLPILGFLNIYFMLYSLVADHWQYTSLIGVVALIAAGLTVLPQRFGKPQLARPLAIALLLVLSVQTWRQQAAYQSVETLWTDVMQKNPDAWLAHANLGRFYHDQGRIDEAVACYETALEINPDCVPALGNMGAVAFVRGDLDGALAYYRKAAAVKQKAAPIWANIGLVLQAQGREREAIDAYQQALEIGEDFPPALQGWAWALATSADPELRDGKLALELVTRAVDSGAHPSVELAGCLAACFAATGDFKGAMEWQQRAVAMAPPEQREEMIARLDWYRQGRPLHALLHQD